MGSADHSSADFSMRCGACLAVGAVADLPNDASALASSLLRNLDSLDDLARWRDEVISLHRQVLDTSADPDGASCAGNHDASPVAHLVAISTLEALLAAGIDRMRENGELAVDADPGKLAMGMTAALQGGSLLARTSRDIALLEVALDLALNYVRAHSAR